MRREREMGGGMRSSESHTGSIDARRVKTEAHPSGCSLLIDAEISLHEPSMSLALLLPYKSWNMHRTCVALCGGVDLVV